MNVDLGLRSEPAIASPLPAASVVLRLRLIDGFSLVCDGRAIALSVGTQRLLALLAIHDRPLHRIYVAGTLWPDAMEKQAAANLRSALWRLSQPDDGRATVMASPQRLALAAGVEVDLREAVAAAKGLVVGSGPPAADVSMFASDLLNDWYEDWVVVARERFRQLRLHALEAMCRLLTAQGKCAQAVEAGLAAVVGEPLRESAHRVLIEAHLAEGNRGEALRQHELFRTLLRDELGVDPSPLMQALLQRVRG